MAVSKYLRNYNNKSEQNLLESLIIESIKHRGIDILYLPRSPENQDHMYEEATRVDYNIAVQIEAYLESFEAFQGDGTFMSNLGVEVRDQCVFSLAQRRFFDETNGMNLPRPREGDLIWYPFNKKLFEIKFVDKFEMHYPLGKLYTFKIRCELFEYAGQTFQTGVEGIDAIPGELSQNMLDYYQHDADGNLLLDANNNPILVSNSNLLPYDPLDDSEQIQKEADEIIDFSETNPFSEGAW